MDAEDVEEVLGRLSPKIEDFARSLDDSEREVFGAILALAERGQEDSPDFHPRERAYVAIPKPEKLNSSLSFSTEALVALLPSRAKASHDD